MTMVYPYDKISKTKTFKKKGKHQIPGNGLNFEIEAPFSPVYVKIFALKKKPSFEFEFKSINGNYIAVFTHENCKKFVEQIKKTKKDEVFCRSLNFSRSKN